MSHVNVEYDVWVMYFQIGHNIKKKHMWHYKFFNMEIFDIIDINIIFAVYLCAMYIHFKMISYSLFAQFFCFLLINNSLTSYYKGYMTF